MSFTFARNALGCAFLFGAAGCAAVSPGPSAAAVSANTADLPIASDAAADSLLTDVRALAPGIVVETDIAFSGGITKDHYKVLLDAFEDHVKLMAEALKFFGLAHVLLKEAA